MAKFDIKKSLAGHLDDDGKVPFVGKGVRPSLTRPLVLRHYEAGRSIKWLGEDTTIGAVINAALPAWHPASMLGTPFSGGSVVPREDRPFIDAKGWKALSKKKVDGLCQIAHALGIPNMTFHAQVDVVDEAEDVLETGDRIEEVTPIWKETLANYGIDVLWGTANQFSNSRQILGSSTSPNGDAFKLTAIKQKQALQLTAALGGKGFIVWDGQGGEYDSLIFRPEHHYEQANSMMRKVVELAESVGLFVAIEPKPFEPSMGQIHRNVTETLYHIGQARLLGRVGLNPEFDHAKLDDRDICAEVLRAGEHFYTCDANQGDGRVGYDVDRFLRDLTMAVTYWLSVAYVGGYKHGGGTNFDAKPDVKSPALLDLLSGLCMTLDTLAGALKIAVKIIEDGELQAVLDDIYGSENFTDRDAILSDDVSLADIEAGVRSGNGLGRPKSLPADTAHNILNAYITDGVPE